ncbi:MAG: Ig-like domain-containing protein [Mycobacterium sp.]|nr:Ig-like domain-containing protein [Mycobacterium sp.]
MVTNGRSGNHEYVTAAGLRRRGRHRAGRPRRVQPYAWLGAGAVGFGLGAAALTGAGSAHADDSAADASSSASEDSSTVGANDSRAVPSGADPDDGTQVDGADDSATADAAVSVEAATETDVVDGGSQRAPSRSDAESRASAVEDHQDDDAVTVDLASDPGGSAPAAVSAAANTEPTAALSWQSSPGRSTGRVAGRISAADADGDRLTFAGTAATGAVAVTSRGSFTYTPNTAARHAAAATNVTPARVTDTFDITVNDGRGGSAAVPVTVRIRPANSSPTRLRSTVATPDPATGQVTGRITATDRDGDSFTYTAAAPSDGAVTVNADGSFTYNPSDAARGRAYTTRYTDTDNFRVLLDDGHGATRAITVRVRIAPHNSAPVPGTPTYGSPDLSTGAVGGSVTATDPDGDRITYRLSAPPPKGALVVTADGRFTYTPTPVARHAAATGLAGTTTDTATVVAGDSFGAATAIPLTFTILPANAAPANPRVTVGQPNSTPGVVTGVVTADDADGDVLTYRGSTTTAKGAMSVAAAGTFAYTPTATARQNAQAPGATAADRADSFVVTVDDGHGGTVTLPVTVAVGSALVPDPPDPPPPPGALPAFPGAEGFGSLATGGRGGSVVYVTNTDAAGPGSLQWAIDQPGAKYILFKVSGLIDAQIHLTNGDVTIAGQTSPGGITIRGLVTDESPYQDQAVRAPADFAENWVLQHIRIRPGLNGPSDDGLRLRYTRNAIVDHVSIGNATDEAVEISYSNNITIQNSIIAETLGGHSFYGGVLMNYSNPAHGFGLDNVALHHNIITRIEGRLPEGSRESLAAAYSTMNLELSNNLYWDPRFFIALGPNTNVVTDGRGNPYPIYWNLNAVNNYFRTGSQFPYGMFDDQILRVSGNSLYVSGNRMSRYPSRSDYDLFYCCNDFASVDIPDGSAHRAQKLTARHPFPAITYTPTDMLPTVLRSRAGAWPRDPMDIRLLQSLAADTISPADPATNPAGDAHLPAYTGAAPAAPLDTDGDGMPDAWETVKGLNPLSANHNATTLSLLGYTDLEVYLHGLSASLVDPAIA